jgi:hypothetical protein
VSTGLIIAIVVAFLAVDAVIFLLVFRSRRTADDYATFAVPGEATVMLPAGKLKLSYQESYKAPSSGDTIDFDIPSASSVTVMAPTGETFDIKGPGFRGMGASLNTGSGWSRALIGTVQIAQVGEYTVTAHGELPNAIEPQVLIGK